MSSGRRAGGIAIDISIAAGAWPGEGDLRSIAEAAISAILEVIRAPRARRGPSPAPPHKAEKNGAASADHLPSPLPHPASKERISSIRLAETEISILFTDDAAIRRLNSQFRGQDKPTNVLSFPQPAGPLLGDIVLAYETVTNEAALAGKPIEAHMAHLVIHGFLHLLGFDHETDAEAETMEAYERSALAGIGISDPYAGLEAR